MEESETHTAKPASTREPGAGSSHRSGSLWAGVGRPGLRTAGRSGGAWFCLPRARVCGTLSGKRLRNPGPEQASTHTADRQPTLAQLRHLPAAPCAATCAAICMCARVHTRMPSSVPFRHVFLFVRALGPGTHLFIIADSLQDYPAVRLPIRLATHLCLSIRRVYPSVYLPKCLFVYPSVWQSVRLSIHVCLSVSPCLSIRLH